MAEGHGLAKTSSACGMGKEIEIPQQMLDIFMGLSPTFANLCNVDLSQGPGNARGVGVVDIWPGVEIGENVAPEFREAYMGLYEKKGRFKCLCPFCGSLREIPDLTLFNWREAAQMC